MTDQPGILALWNDCAPEGEADYERWYMADHLPERVGIPGFRFGRRYRRVEGDRTYFTFYETDSPSVLWSPVYLERLQNPTSWTQRVMPSFRNTIRTVCRRAASRGTALGGHVATFRAMAEDTPGPDVEAELRRSILPDLLARDGVCHVHLWIATRQQTPSKTVETDIRGADEMLSWAVVVETTSEVAARAMGADARLRARIEQLAPSGQPAAGCYRLICHSSQVMMTVDDWA